MSGEMSLLHLLHTFAEINVAISCCQLTRATVVAVHALVY